MAACFDAVCMVWQPPDSAPGEQRSPPSPHVSFIGFRVRNVVQNQPLPPPEEQPPTVVVLLYDDDHQHPDVPMGIDHIAQLLSLVGVPPFYLAPVVQVIHSKAVAMAYQATNGASGTVSLVVTEIPITLWFFPHHDVQVHVQLHLQQGLEEDIGNEDEEEDEDTESTIIFEEGTDMDVDMDMGMNMEGGVVATATNKASIDAILERPILEALNAEDKCIICLEDLLVEIEVSKMPCSHVFHTDCIMEWLKKSHVCPLCRFKMPKY